MPLVFGARRTSSSPPVTCAPTWAARSEKLARQPQRQPEYQNRTKRRSAIMTDQLIETFADGVATLTMNRPEARNALTGEMQAALSEAVKRHAADPRTRV